MRATNRGRTAGTRTSRSAVLPTSSPSVFSPSSSPSSSLVAAVRPRWCTTVTQLADAASHPQYRYQQQQRQQQQQSQRRRTNVMSLVERPSSIASPSASSSIMLPPDFALPVDWNEIPQVDLEGGTLLDVTQDEEVDPADGCRVRIIKYRIQTEDGELTKTIRRKIRVECTQRLRRMEMSSTDKKAKVQESTQHVLADCGTLQGGYAPVQMQNTQRELELDPTNPTDMAVANTLAQTTENFQKMLTDQRAQFAQLFPDLFSNAICAAPATPSGNDSNTPSSELMPLAAMGGGSRPAARLKMQNEPGQVERVIAADGTVTTRTRTTKSYSSSYSTHSTYKNGVCESSVQSRRAFVQYRGPQGGFQLCISDNGGQADSEEITDEEELNSQLKSFFADRRALLNTVPLDETSTPTSSVPGASDVEPSAALPSLDAMPAKESENLSRRAKAWHAAKELVDSEQRYVDKLKMLESFRVKVMADVGLDGDKAARLFSNLHSLHDFHVAHLLPQLLDAERDWHTKHMISGVLMKLAPFLRMYSEYTNNYRHATQTFQELQAKKKFAAIVDEFERRPDCDSLPLVQHLICPVQRIMRYQLLLQEYRKHLDESDPDWDTTNSALKQVLQAAEHANDIIKKLDGYRNVIEVQEQLGNVLALVSPGRELLRRGQVHKISTTTEKPEERVLFLFNDLIVLASERNLMGFSKYKLRAVFHAQHTQLLAGDNLECESSFYLRGTDGTPDAAVRCVELAADPQDQQPWCDSIASVLADAQRRHASFSPSPPLSATDSSSRLCPSSDGGSISSSSTSSTSSSTRFCAACDAELGRLFRSGTRCQRCQRKLCRRCFGRSSATRVCEFCLRNPSTCRDALGSGSATATAGPEIGPRDGNIVHASNVDFKGPSGRSLTRYWVVRRDCCLYSYPSINAESAAVVVPLAGCEVRVGGATGAFVLRCANRREYTVQTSDETMQAKWIAVLDLTANAAPDCSTATTTSSNGGARSVSP